MGCSPSCCSSRLSTGPSQSTILKILLALIVLVNGALWFSVRHVQARWTNVPPVPSMISAVTPTLGDKQFAYRTIGLSLQNFGNTGGRVVGLSEYNHKELGRWMMLQHRLDPRSNFTPTLAGYLFSGGRSSKDLHPIIDYLEVAGSVNAPKKWRWLAQAAYLARYKMKDNKRALGIAYKLAALDESDMPAWTKQMPAFIMSKSGEKESALALMFQILKTEGEDLHPNEINAIKAYICEQILNPQEAKTTPLCQAQDF